MATITTTQEAMKKSAELQELKKKEIAARSECPEKPRNSKCAVLGTLTRTALIAALGLLGHEIHEALEQNRELETKIINYVSVPENTLTNMTEYIKDLEKSNAKLVKAQDTLDALLENNPTNPTQPYSKQQWLKKEIAKASGEVEEEEEDTSKAVVKSKGRKKGGFFNEHFSLNF